MVLPDQEGALRLSVNVWVTYYYSNSKTGELYVLLGRKLVSVYGADTFDRSGTLHCGSGRTHQAV